MKRTVRIKITVSIGGSLHVKLTFKKPVAAPTGLVECARQGWTGARFYGTLPSLMDAIGYIR